MKRKPQIEFTVLIAITIAISASKNMVLFIPVFIYLIFKGIITIIKNQGWLYFIPCGIAVVALCFTIYSIAIEA